MIDSYSILLHFEAFRHKEDRYPIHLRLQRAKGAILACLRRQ